MPAIITLVIYLSATDAADPSATVLVHSAQEIVGNATRVTLRETRDTIGDDELEELASDTDAVANIAWLGSDHRRAQVRCYLGQVHRLIKREITFDQESAAVERERMLGFVVASMLPAAPESPNADPPNAEVTVIDHSAAPTPPLARPKRFVGMVEVTGLAVAGVRGSASTIGASLAARLLWGRSWAVRIAGGLRRGYIPSANAASEVDFLGLGLGFESPVAAGSRFAIGGRAGALVLRHAVSHLSADDLEPDDKSRLLPGADALIEGALHLSSSAGLLAGVGSELALGQSKIFVKGKEVADIPPLRLVAELGIQALF